MKIAQIQQQNNNKMNNTPQFKGGVDSTLRFLATNQAIGANLTDLGFMVIPRVATDAKRGPEACTETLRREASGTANHSLIGVYGAGAGCLAAAVMGIDRQFGAKVNGMFAAPETVNILAELKAKQLKNKTTQLDYIKEVLSQVKIYNPKLEQQADEKGFVKLSKETIDEIAAIIDNAISNKEWEAWKDKKSSNSIEVVLNKITEKTGAQGNAILESSDKKIVSNTNLRTLLEDTFKISKSFNKNEVKKAFEDQIAKNGSLKDNAYISKLSKFMKARSIGGFILGSAIGMSIQPLNIYLTKRKTGSDGFVGVEGRSKDNSTEFKLLKGAAAAGFGGLTLWTLGTGLKGFMSKMAFTGFFPSMEQLKGIYGLTIISRLLATRDKDELREALTKDTLGFLSWLVLGDVVNRMTAEKLDNSVMKRSKDVDKQNFFKRVFNSKLKTRDEVLIEALASEKISTVKKDGDKVIAKNLKEMMKDLDNMTNQKLKAETKKRLRTLNKAQLAGYLFSGLVLGLGIPNLNIYITNTLDKKRKAKLAENQNAQSEIAKA